MRWGNYVRKSITSLVLPGSIAARQRQQHVIDLAADIRELGDEPIHAPVFRDETGLIISGRDRMAALLLNKAERCWIRWASCTDQEASDMEVSENLFRRVDNRDELIARRVRRVVEQVAKERTSQRRGTTDLTPTGNGPKRADTTAARERVARELNTTPKAVKRAEQRAAAAKDIPARVDAPIPVDRGNSAASAGGELATTHALCPIDKLGTEPSAAFCERVSLALACLEKANLLAQQAQREIAPLKDAALFPGALYQRLKADLHAAAAAIRYAKPGLVCAYCRDPGGEHGRNATCNGCGGHGWLTEEQRASVPREMFGARGVVATRPVRKATLRIEDDAGNPIDVTKDDPPSLPLFDEPAEDTQ